MCRDTGADRPNFLFIITDQQRADTLGAYGSSVRATPNLDRLASESVVFDRAYCTNPLCMPSRASLLTGRYPSTCGVRTNGCIAKPNQPLLPALLSEAGYDTAAFGKLHYHPIGGEPQGYWPENLHLARSDADLTQPYLGFRTIRLAGGHGPVIPGMHARFLRDEYPEVLEAQGAVNTLETCDELLRTAHKIETYKPRVPPELHPTTWIVDRTVEFLDRAGEQPFFAWCGITDPHHPFCPPGEYWDRYTPAEMPAPVRREGELDDKPPHFQAFYRGDYHGLDTDGFLLGSEPYLNDARVRMIMAKYYGMVAFLDDGVGRLLDALTRNGLDRKTVVVFLTDHGEFMGDHGFMLKGPMHYENLIRVPLLVRYPGAFAPSRVSGGPVSLADLFPTITELAGAPHPEGTQGKTLVPQLRGETRQGHDAVLIENDVDALGLRLRTLVTERWKMTSYAGQNFGELYDLENDPHEFTNLWSTCDGRVKAALTEQMLQFVLTQQEWMPPKMCHA